MSTTMREMLEAGVHFGHQTRFWNPKMAPFIFGHRNKIHIINLEKSLPMFQDAMKYAKQLTANRGTILMVGTKRQAREIVAAEARRAGVPFVDTRWLGGMLTNFKTVKGSLKKLKDMQAQKESGAELRIKKEALLFDRELTKLEKDIGGIQDMNALPDALFVIDVGFHKIAIAEAKKLGIPVIAVVDTNHSPDGVDYVIPGNDDSAKAVALYAKSVADAVLEGKANANTDLVQAVAATGDDLIQRRWGAIERGASVAPFSHPARASSAHFRRPAQRPPPPPRRNNMPAITASLVAELRAKTDAPMMECKKALTEAEGDMERAEELLRVKLGSKAGKAASRITAEGIVASAVVGGNGALIEVNCETDFVSKNDAFLAFVGALAGLAGATKTVVLGFETLTDVHWTMSGLVILMTLVGGMGTLVGPMVGALVIIALENKIGDFGKLLADTTGIAPITDLALSNDTDRYWWTRQSWRLDPLLGTVFEQRRDPAANRVATLDMIRFTAGTK
eukprot:gene38307-50279_t